MAERDRLHWDRRYAAGGGPRAGAADARLARYAGPVAESFARAVDRGETPAALDVACGAGGTLRSLAAQGWSVTGVDVSQVALDLAAQALDRLPDAPAYTLLRRDLDTWRPQPECYHLVTCFYFLERALWSAMAAAVRPGGLLILETFNRHRLAVRPESNPDHLLAPGELVEAVQGWGWTVLAHHSDPPGGERPTDGIAACKSAVDK